LPRKYVKLFVNSNFVFEAADAVNAEKQTMCVNRVQTSNVGESKLNLPSIMREVLEGAMGNLQGLLISSGSQLDFNVASIWIT